MLPQSRTAMGVQEKVSPAKAMVSKTSLRLALTSRYHSQATATQVRARKLKNGSRRNCMVRLWPVEHSLLPRTPEATHDGPTCFVQ